MTEFAERYRPKIYGWCLAWGLQQADAEDVAQDVLRRMLEAFASFEYDPKRSFRGYLRTVTKHAFLKWQEAQKRSVRATGDSAAMERLYQVRARVDLETRLKDAFDLEIKDEAMRRVEGRFARHNWEAFVLFKIEDLSGAEIQERLGITPSSMYPKVRQIVAEIADEIRRIQADPEVES